jgi:hypothetical protein
MLFWTHALFDHEADEDSGPPRRLRAWLLSVPSSSGIALQVRRYGGTHHFWASRDAPLLRRFEGRIEKLRLVPIIMVTTIVPIDALDTRVGSSEMLAKFAAISGLPAVTG